MPARVELFAGRPITPDCETCPDGVEVALTAVMWGVPDAVDADGLGVSVGEALADETRFLQAVADRVNAPGPCCITAGFRVRYDPTRTVRETAEEVAAFLNGVAVAMAQAPFVARVRFHLIGFSAGGQVAINVASRVLSMIPRAPTVPLQDRLWCGRLLGEKGGLAILVETDLVTIATPLGSSGGVFGIITGLSELAGFLAGLGRRLARLFASARTFATSVGEDDYGGPRPARLCRYVGIVTCGDYDSSPGAEEDPRDDPARLGAWQPQVVALRREAGEPTRHTDAAAVAVRRFPGAFALGCACISAPAGPGECED
jgi:hypothetical protein